MPRESFNHTTPVSITELVSNHVPGNYSNTSALVYDLVDSNSIHDRTFRVTRVAESYQEARIQKLYVIPLGVPLILDYNTKYLKLVEDELFYRLTNGEMSELSWDHCVRADYCRADDFIFSAIRHDQDFQLQLTGTISILETMRAYCENIPEVKDLNERMFEMPQTNRLQKYIACIVLDKDYSSAELLLMVQSLITRKKYQTDDLSNMAGMLILLPMVRQLFRGTLQADRQSSVTRIHQEFKAKLASLRILSRADGVWRKADVETCGGSNNSQWINTACELAANFGITDTDVESLRQEMQTHSVRTMPTMPTMPTMHTKPALLPKSGAFASWASYPKRKNSHTTGAGAGAGACTTDRWRETPKPQYPKTACW